MINVGIIGFGYWGPNLARNVAASDQASLVMVADLSEERLARVAKLYPNVRTTTSAVELINDSSIDAVVIATPVATHFELAMAALHAGKHVLVEKPIAATSEQARRLADEADRLGLTLLVDHTFVYTGAVRKMRELIQADAFGPVRYYDSTRVNLGIFQNDVNVLWDLAVHDLSIMSHVLREKPIAVSATGKAHQQAHPEFAAFLTIFFENIIAHINVNWLSPVKIRRTLIGGANQMIVYDDLETSEKIKLYDKGVTVTETPDDLRRLLISYRTGDLWSPKVDDTEALAIEVDHFAACIAGKETPRTGGEEGLRLVQILEAADRSIRTLGAPVYL